MKTILFLLLAFSTCIFAQKTETEVEWKVIANPGDLGVENAVATFLKTANESLTTNDTDKAVLKYLRDLVSTQPVKLVPADLLKLKQVRSIQIEDYGVFTYPYFSCRFKKTDRGFFFEKTTGSQRRSGTLFQNDQHSLAFLGSWTVNDDPQGKYSGFTRNKDSSSDSVGLFIKREKTYLAIFPGKKGACEVYEFK